MDTIFAQATAPGKAGVSVIRVSGPSAFAGVGRLCVLPPRRQAGLRTISDIGGAVLDTGLVITFGEGASFTGEQVVELQLHGSLAVVSAVQCALGQLPGFRPAGPGEFTRRALENRRLDLAQVEGLADLIDAETEVQRKQALSVLEGDLSKAVNEWRCDLLEAAALIEATLDFADEDVPVDVGPDVHIRLQRVTHSLQTQIDGFSAAERIRDGFEVAIMGPPNAGKSTLLNAIAKRPAALTSEIAGTTRDVIEVRVDLDGLPVTFLDTAGLRDTNDPVESAGIALARHRASAADLRVWLATSDSASYDGMDLIYRSQDDEGRHAGVSGITGYGIAAMLETISQRLAKTIPSNRLAVRERHRDAIQRALCALRAGMNSVDRGELDELTAEHLRQAARSLAELIGGVDVEDLLGHIFSRFCIGK